MTNTPFSDGRPKTLDVPTGDQPASWSASRKLNYDPANSCLPAQGNPAEHAQ
jgi:hypothetical protein